MKDGQNLAGIVSDENLATITLSESPLVRRVWSKAAMLYSEPRTWSLMPDGLEQGLSPQDMADLLEYLTSAPE